LDYPELTPWPLIFAKFARGIIETCGQQFTYRPDMIRNPECHSGRLTDGFMHAAKIITRNVQANGSNVMIKFLAETVRQSRKAPLLHAESQILPLDVAGRDMARKADFIPALYRYYIARGIPARGILVGF
jgi:hypothetical protein